MDTNYAKPTPLNPKSTGGVVGQPHISDGYMPATDSSGASASITGPKGEVETTYDHANLGTRWGYPNVSQDIPEKGRNQFEAQS